MNRKYHQATIFTDGSSRGNPGPGGWGVVIVEERDGETKVVSEFGGGEDRTTNNRMELTAAIEALKNTPKGALVALYTDSSYLIHGITKWVKTWKRVGWITRVKENVLNKDLWQELDTLALEREIRWQYVGGHVGIPGNERCDEIATAFADSKKIDLFRGSFEDYEIQNILDTKAAELKVETKSRRDAIAYSYISAVQGIVEVHHSWAECERRVKGVRGARYKKALNPEEQEKIIAEFSEL